MPEERKRPGFLAVLKSVLSAMFGVQSAKNHERDFTHGHPMAYIGVGLLMTLVFILVVWGVVQLVLSLSGV